MTLYCISWADRIIFYWTSSLTTGFAATLFMKTTTKIIIGVDARLAIECGRGWGRYATDFLLHMNKRSNIQLKILLADSKSGRKLASRLIDAEITFMKPHESGHAGLAIQHSMQGLEITKLLGSIDIFHSLTRFVADINDVPVIATVHDIAPISVPPYKLQFLAVSQLSIAKIIQNNIHLIAVSKFTKSEIIRFTSVPENKISVIYQGNTFASIRIDKASKVNDKAIKLLYVGGAGDNKNIMSLVECVKILSTHYKLELHLVGDNRWGYAELRRNKTIYDHQGVAIIFHDLVSDRALSDLYTQCDVFVFPSLHEGFGLPVIEAMHHKTPVCCSDIAIMHEVAGDAAQYFSPSDPVSMAQTIKQVLNDQSLLNNMVVKGVARSKKFKWDSCISQTIDLYHHVIKNKER